MNLIDIFPLTDLKREPDFHIDCASLSSKLLNTPNGRTIPELLHETGDFLKRQTGSKGYILYIYDQVKEVLSFIPTESTSIFDECSYASWKIESAKTLAVYVFKHQRSVIIDNAKPSIDEIYLGSYELLGIPNLNPRHILALPISNSAERCFGVIELYKDSANSYYTKSDLLPCEFLLNLCAEAITFNESAIYYKSCNQVQTYFLQFIKVDQCKNNLTKLEDDAGFLNEFSFVAQKMFGVRKVAIFIEHNAELTCIKETTEEMPTEDIHDHLIRKPLIRTQLVVPFQRNFAGKTECFQRGFIYLYNKQFFPKEFTRKDRDFLNMFAKSASLWMYLENMRGVFREQECYNNLILSIIAWELKHAERHNYIFDRLVPIPDAGMVNRFDYKPNFSKALPLAICSLCYDMISGHTAQLEPKSLRNFIKMLQVCHRENDPIHFFGSAFFDAHAIFCMLTATGQLFTENEKIALLIALLCGHIAVDFPIRKNKVPKYCHILENTTKPSNLLQHNCRDDTKRFWIAKLLFKNSQLIQKEKILEIIEELLTTPTEFYEKIQPKGITTQTDDGRKLVRLIFYRFGRLFGSIKSGVSHTVDSRVDTLSCIDLLKRFCTSETTMSVKNIIFQKMFHD